jgi:hypothetical protein
LDSSTLVDTPPVDTIDSPPAALNRSTGDQVPYCPLTFSCRTRSKHTPSQRVEN